MEELTINAGVLHELLTGASVGVALPKDNRANLMGVHIFALGDSVRVSGTNASKAVIGKVSRESGDYFELLLPAKDLKTVLTLLKQAHKAHTNTVATVSGTGVFTIGDNVTAVTPMSHTFPDTEGIIPDEFPFPEGDTLPAIDFNPEMLGDMAKIPNTGKRVSVLLNYNSRASLATWQNDTGVAWRYLFMPLRPNV
jgi:hypothetical protein